MKPVHSDEELLKKLAGASSPDFARRHGQDRKAYNGEANTEQPPAAKVIDAGAFLRSYEPLSYTIDGVLPSGYLYGLTGVRGHGKTAMAIAATIACAKGDKTILGCRVKQGRVAYVTKENPTDFKMKLAVNCYVHNLSFDDVAPLIAIIQDDDSPEAIMEGLKLNAEQHGQFVLVIYDTFQAGFDGDEFNNNAQVLKFIKRLRPLTKLPGQPAVLVLMHPTKNAGEDNLVPYGGGSIMNEVDGNLTVWSSGSIKLRWNKVRGPEFEPYHHKIEKLSCPDIVDIEGRQILLPVMRPSDAESVEAREKSNADTSRALLKAMADVPTGTQADWATTIQKSKSTINDHLQKLRKQGFVTESLSKWRLTKKGKDIVANT